jgi:hypothetical protein
MERFVEQFEEPPPQKRRERLRDELKKLRERR